MVVYIRENGCQMYTRVVEHLDEASSSSIKKSAVAQNLAESNNHIEADWTIFIHYENLFWRKLALEHIEIVSHMRNNDMILNNFDPHNNLIEKLYTSNHLSQRSNSSWFLVFSCFPNAFVSFLL